MARIKPLHMLSAVTLASLALRLLLLAEKPVGLDEIHTLIIIGLPLQEALDYVAMVGWMPAYFLLAWAAEQLLSLGPGIRLISILFGTLTIPLVYLLGERLLGARAGLAASFLLAIHPFHIGYSQYMKEYAMLIFLFAASCLLFLKVMEARDRRIWAAFTVLNALMFLTHFLSIILIVSQFAAWIFTGARRKSVAIGFLSHAAAVLALSFPWLLKLFSNPVVRDYGGAFDYDLLRIGYVFFKLSIGVNVSGFLSWVPALFWLSLPFFALLFFLGALSLFRSGRKPFTIVITLLLAPPILLFTVSSLAFNVFNYRYLSPLLAVYVLLPAAYFAGKGRLPALLLTAALLLAADAYYFSVITLEDWPVLFGI